MVKLVPQQGAIGPRAFASLEPCVNMDNFDAEWEPEGRDMQTSQ